MKILVTGGQGFLGSHLVDELIDHHECGVCVFDRSWKSQLWADFAWHDVDFYCGDLKDRESVFEAVRLCDRWVNLGGLLGTSELIGNPMPAVEVNIAGAINVFDAAVEHEKIGLQIEVGNYWMDNPYSITKNCAARFAEMYRKYKKADIRIVRAMNVYGPRQKHRPIRKIFPNVAIPALLNKPITVYGDGEQVMDMVYVKDAVQILAKVVLADELPPITFEAGAGGITINKFVHTVCSAASSQSEIRHIPMRKGEKPGAVVKISKEGWDDLAEHLDYDSTDQMPLEKGVETTVLWYKDRLDQFPWDE